MESAELDRSIKFEGVLLLGDTHTAEAGQKINEALWDLQQIAKIDATVSDDAAWRSAFRRYREARSDFYTAARQNMGVPAAHTPIANWFVPTLAEPATPSTAALVQRSSNVDGLETA